MNNKVITMKDISKELNLSINAVSIALNDKKGVSIETKHKIINKAEEMGYFNIEKKYVKTFANSNLCLMVDEMYVNDSFYSQLIFQIEFFIKKKGFDMIINFFNSDSFKIPMCISSRKVSGIVIVGNILQEHIDIVVSNNIPVVLIDNLAPLADVDSIVTNNTSGTYKATNYLIKKGIVDIGFFGDINYSSSVANRFLGYKNRIQKMFESDYMEKNNREIDILVNKYIMERSVLSNIEKYIINNNTDKILQIIKNIEIMPKAFVCSNDYAAARLIVVLKELKFIIPQDISIFGFDDSAICDLISPSITTVRVDKEYMAEKTIEKLMEKIYNKNKKVEIIQIGISIIERDSVK